MSILAAADDEAYKMRRGLGRRQSRDLSLPLEYHASPVGTFVPDHPL